MNLKSEVFFAVFDFENLISYAKNLAAYKKINPFALIKLDKTFTLTANTTYAAVRGAAEKSKLLKKIEVISLYKNKLSLRFYYCSPDRNITEEEAKRELEKIKE